MIESTIREKVEFDKFPEVSRKEIVVLIRGHIRNTFKDRRLYDFLTDLGDRYSVRLYIHTWNTYSSSLSWRKVEENNSIVSFLDIVTYFSGLNCEIQHIEIDDEKGIELIGDTTGNVFSTQLPKLAWKRMWYGINKMMEMISVLEDPSTMVVNTRFDLFNNSYSQNNKDVLFRLIDTNLGLTDIKFLNNPANLLGVDNYYIGPPKKLYKLVNHFHTNLDSINEQYKKISFQEVVVFYENNRLFLTGGTDDQVYENIAFYILSANNNNENVDENKDESFRNSLGLKIDNFLGKEGSPMVEGGLLFVKTTDETYVEYKRHNYFLNARSVRETPILSVKHTSSDWKGFGKKAK